MGRRTVHHKEDLTTGELISGWEVRELLRLVGAETCFIAAHTNGETGNVLRNELITHFTVMLTFHIIEVALNF